MYPLSIHYTPCFNIEFIWVVLSWVILSWVMLNWVWLRHCNLAVCLPVQGVLKRYMFELDIRFNPLRQCPVWTVCYLKWHLPNIFSSNCFKSWILWEYMKGFKCHFSVNFIVAFRIAPKQCVRIWFAHYPKQVFIEQV